MPVAAEKRISYIQYESDHGGTVYMRIREGVERSLTQPWPRIERCVVDSGSTKREC